LRIAAARILIDLADAAIRREWRGTCVVGSYAKRSLKRTGHSSDPLMSSRKAGQRHRRWLLCFFVTGLLALLQTVVMTDFLWNGYVFTTGIWRWKEVDVFKSIFWRGRSSFPSSRCMKHIAIRPGIMTAWTVLNVGRRRMARTVRRRVKCMGAWWHTCSIC
jgi:hypothetical protein